MFKKFFNFIKDTLFESLWTECDRIKVFNIISIRTIITICIALKVHMLHRVNSVEKAAAIMLFGVAWIKR